MDSDEAERWNAMSEEDREHTVRSDKDRWRLHLVKYGHQPTVSMCRCEACGISFYDEYMGTGFLEENLPKLPRCPVEKENP